MSRFPATRAATSGRSLSFCFALLAAFSLAGPLPSACADITATGDVEPTDANTWTTSTTSYIGHTSGGTLTVSSAVSSSSASCIGYSSTGVVTVNGAARRSAAAAWMSASPAMGRRTSPAAGP